MLDFFKAQKLNLTTESTPYHIDQNLPKELLTEDITMEELEAVLRKLHQHIALGGKN
jgi:hypothetical protein